MEQTSCVLHLDALEFQMDHGLNCIEDFRPDDNQTRLRLEQSFKELLDVCSSFGDARAKNIQNHTEELLSTRDLSEPFLERIHLTLQLDAL